MGNDWIDAEGFRANVGIILANSEDKLMLGGRVGARGWQFPQGGPHYEALYGPFQVSDSPLTGVRCGSDTIDCVLKIAVNRSKRIVNLNITLTAGFKAGPFLGLSGQDHKNGASVQSIVPGTAAAKAKLLPNDVITKLEKQTIKNLAELQKYVGQKKAGQTILIEVLRGTRKLKLKLTLGMRG